MNRKLKVILISIVGNLILAASKIVISFFTGSLALGADGFHSFIDLLVSVIVMAGILTSSGLAEKKKRTSVKVESIITLVVSLFVIGIAVVFFRELWFHEHVQLSMLPLAIGGQSVLIIFTYLIYKYKFLVGTEEKSQSIVADSYHTRADLLTSIGVLIALLGSMIGLDLDRITAFILFFIILYQGLEMLIGAIRVLLQKEKGLPVNFRFPIIKKFQKIKEYIFLRKKLSVGIVSIFLIIVYLFFSFSTININQRAVLFLVGRVVKDDVKPGLLFNPLFPFTELEVINTSEIRTMRVGYRLDSKDISDVLIHQWETIHISKAYSNFSEESEVLAGDGNILHVSLNIDYNISSAKDFILNNKDPEILMREMTDSLVMKEFGKHDVFKSLLSRREDIEQNIQKVLQTELDRYSTGIKITNVVLFDLHPPEETIGPFRTVYDDEEYYKIKMYNAEAYRETQIPYARGLVKEIDAKARSESKSIILKAKQDVELFKSLETAFKNNPDEVSLRTVLETWESVLTDKQKIVFFKGISKGKIRLDLSEGSYILR